MFSLIRNKIALKSISFQSVRCILDNKILGVEKFMASKERNLMEKDKVFERVKAAVQNGHVFTDDLKKLSHCVQNKEDAAFLMESFKLYASKKENIGLNTFRIGPLVARAFYYVNDYESLDHLINNQDTKQLFMNESSISVFLMLLYNNKKYEEIVDFCLKLFKAETLDKNDSRFENTFIVCLGAALNIPSKETFEKIRELYKIYANRQYNHKNIFSKKSMLLFINLCLKTGNIEEAFEVSQNLKGNDEEISNIKLLLFAKIKAYDLLKNKLDYIKLKNSTGVYKEVLDEIKNILQSDNAEELLKDVDSLQNELIIDKNLEKAIFDYPIIKNLNPYMRNGQMRQSMNYNRNNNYNRYNDRNRQQFNDGRNFDRNQRTFRPFQTRFKEESSDII